MSDAKVIPFRKRPPTKPQLEIYRMMTRSWSAQMKQMMFPDYFRYEQRKDERNND
jgi:hypothetical protein